MKYEAVLFDMNGVLVDDEMLQEDAFRQVLSHIGYELSPDDYKKYFAGRTDKEGFENYLASQNKEADVSKLSEEKTLDYFERIKSGVEGYDGTKEFAEETSFRGLKLAIVTSSNRNEADSLISGLGFTPLLSATITGDDVLWGKPDPESYLKAAAELGVEPARCLVIEDTPSGITAARSAGMDVIGVTNTHTAEELAGASRVVEKLSIDLLS
jgi:HAD superfamily hydrolase (TIGR01509 family)